MRVEGYFKTYYQEHKEEVKERSEKWNEKNKPWLTDRRREYCRIYRIQYHAHLKQTVLNHYGTTCKICGETDFKKLCIDHIHENGKTHREDLGLKREGFNTQFYSWLIKNNFPEVFQYTIRHLRKSKGLTQWDLARELGCTENYVWMMEAGHRIPSKSFSDLLAAFYQCNPVWMATLRVHALISRFSDRVGDIENV